MKATVIVNSFVAATLPTVKARLNVICAFLQKQEDGFAGQILEIANGHPSALLSIRPFNCGGLNHDIFKSLCTAVLLPVPDTTFGEAPKESIQALFPLFAEVIKAAMAENQLHTKLIKAVITGASKNSAEEGSQLTSLLLDN